MSASIVIWLFGDDGTILRFTDSYQEFANILLYRTLLPLAFLMSKLLKIQFQDKKQSTE